MNDTNGEDLCAISHEDLVDGTLTVQLGTKLPHNCWTQTSVLNWSSLLQYLFATLPRVEEVFSHRSQWAIVCPISKSEIDMTGTRPIGMVIREAERLLKKESAQ